MKTPIRIAYVTVYDASDVRNWSGSGKYIGEAIKGSSITLEHVGPLRWKSSRLVGVKRRIYNRILNRRYLMERDPIILRDFAHQVAQRIRCFQPDIVFSPGTIPIAYLDCRQPIAFWTDATFAGMVDFYPDFTNLCRESIRHGNLMEASALGRSALALYASEWAARSATGQYSVHEGKVKVVPFGANIECDRTIEDIKILVNKRPADVCKLLFVGVDWYRKGGDIALEVAKSLNRIGLKTELAIAGCEPNIKEALPSFVRTLGFIPKSTKQGRSVLNKLFAESHFLLLPSKAEAFGLVLCEAGSFGVPSLATNVGGIPTIINDDVNGRLFPKDGGIEAYCNYICDLFSKYQTYKDLALSSFNEFEARLNWPVAGKAARKLLEAVI